MIPFVWFLLCRRSLPTPISWTLSCCFVLSIPLNRSRFYDTKPNNAPCFGEIPQNYIKSGQTIKFHQSRFRWNSRGPISLLSHLLGWGFQINYPTFLLPLFWLFPPKNVSHLMASVLLPSQVLQNLFIKRSKSLVSTDMVMKRPIPWNLRPMKLNVVVVVVVVTVSWGGNG